MATYTELRESSSEASSPYSSDGEIATSFGKSLGRLSNAGDIADSISQNGTIFPRGYLSDEEIYKIRNYLGDTNSITNGLPVSKHKGSRIFPSAVSIYLNEHNEDIYKRLRELPGSVVIVTRTLIRDLKQTETSPPLIVICDAIVMSPTQPMMLLTFTEECAGEARIVVNEYNAELTRDVLKHIRCTVPSIGAVFGIIDITSCRTPTTFNDRIHNLLDDAKVMCNPSALSTTRQKSLDVTESLFMLLESNQHDKDLHQSGGVGSAHGIFDRLYHLLTESNDEKELLKQKLGALLIEMEHLKLERIQDARVSLLMRSRSPSISSVTSSGYDSWSICHEEPDEEHTSLEADSLSSSDPDDNQAQVSTHLSIPFTDDPRLIEYNRNMTLHEACRNGKLNVVQYILNRQLADIDCKGSVGRTPVMTTCLRGWINIFKHLTDMKCDLTRVDDNKDNVLHLASKGGSVIIAKELVSTYKLDIHSRGERKRTPVMHACYHAHVGMFHYLLNQGCSLVGKDENGNGPIHLACMGGSVDIVEGLITEVAGSIDSRGMNGWTPIMMATAWGHPAIVNTLLVRGCDVLAVGEDDNNVLHVAATYDELAIAQLVVDRTILDINSRGQYGWTAVMLAAARGSRRVVELLLDRGCDMSCEDPDGNTVLHVACLGGHASMVETVIGQSGIDINAKGKTGRTPVMMAVQNDRRAVVEVLVNAGCDMHVRDDELNTILHVACDCGDVEIVRDVMSYGALGHDVKNYRGRTPIQLAELNGHGQIVTFLSALLWGRTGHIACILASSQG